MADIQPSNNPNDYTVYGQIPGGDNAVYTYKDSKGNIWSSNDGNGQLLVSADVANDPYVASSGLAATDPAAAQAFVDLKKTDPNQYYAQAAQNIQNQIFQGWSNNKGDTTAQYQPLLNDIKANNPQAYYTTELSNLGKQMGWEIGQNTSGRNTATQQQINDLIPQAQKAGLSQAQINDLVNSNIAQGSSINQQRIATDAANGGSGFSFAKDVLPGLKFVGAASAAMLGGGALLGDFAPALDSSAMALGGSGGGGAFMADLLILDSFIHLEFMDGLLKSYK